MATPLRLWAALHPAPALVAGLAIAQAVASFQVRHSNLRLHERMRAAADAGYLPVPCGQALDGLQAWPTALGGGLIFALSVGAALALAAVGAAALWSRSRRGRLEATLLAAAWAAVVVLLNHQGFNPWATLHALLVPPTAFFLARRRSAAPPEMRPAERFATRSLPVLLLAAAWAVQYDAALFTDLRDHLLLSNEAGRKVSAFYYRYTLHAAEAFKRLDQKQLRTVSIDDDDGRLAEALIAIDCLPVSAGGAADLVLHASGGRLAFHADGKPAYVTSADAFLSDPGAGLREAAAAADRAAGLRSLAFAGVLCAFPLALWVVLAALLRAAAGLFLDPRTAEWAAAAAALLVALGPWGVFAASRPSPPTADELAAALSAPRWQERVAALKRAAERRIDLGDQAGLARRAESAHPQERYWLARALAASRKPAAAAVIDRLLDDRDLNVRTQALEALARQGRRSAVAEIRRRLESESAWYVQFYAYRAMRDLGWRQAGFR